MKPDKSIHNFFYFVKKIFIKQLIITFFFLLCSNSLLSQNASAYFSVYVDQYRMDGGGCGGEVGNEEANFYVYLRDNVNSTESSTGCIQYAKDNPFTWDMSPEVNVGYRTNTSDYFILRMWGWEDDGTACSLNSNDECDCKSRDNINIYYRADIYPSNSDWYYPDTWNWCSGESGWAIKYNYFWKYSGSENSITPNCNWQTITHYSGNVRSNSVNLTSGVTYEFETTSGPDTYLRLYASNGYSIVAQDDDAGTGLYSLIIYTATSNGWHYIENSQHTRAKLSSNSVLQYRIAPPRRLMQV